MICDHTAYYARTRPGSDARYSHHQISDIATSTMTKSGDGKTASSSPPPPSPPSQIPAAPPSMYVPPPYYYYPPAQPAPAPQIIVLPTTTTTTHSMPTPPFSPSMPTASSNNNHSNISVNDKNDIVQRLMHNLRPLIPAASYHHNNNNNNNVHDDADYADDIHTDDDYNDDDDDDEQQQWNDDAQANTTLTTKSKVTEPVLASLLAPIAPASSTLQMLEGGADTKYVSWWRDLAWFCLGVIVTLVLLYIKSMYDRYMSTHYNNDVQTTTSIFVPDAAIANYESPLPTDRVQQSSSASSSPPQWTQTPALASPVTIVVSTGAATVPTTPPIAPSTMTSATTSTASTQ